MRARSAEEDALLQAIWEASADDAPRLIYADWLDEHGDPDRAEFIRVQCELARADPVDDRYQQLERREAALRKANRRAWIRGLPSGAHAFRRGFPVNQLVEVPVRAVRRFPLAHWAKVPALALHFYGNLSVLDGLSDWPGLERIGHLWLTGPGLTPGVLGRFLASPRLRNLSALEFEKVPALGPAAVRALADSPVWPRLTRLGVSLCDLSDPAVRVLAKSAPPPGLSEFRFRNLSAGPRGVRALLGSGFLSTVRELELWATFVGSAGVIALAESPHLAAIRSLDLGYVGKLSGQAVERLASASALANLYSLLFGTLADPDAALAFVESPTMVRLRKLMVVYRPRARMSAAVRRKVRARFGPNSVIEAAG